MRELLATLGFLCAGFAARAVRLVCSSCDRAVAAVRLDEPSTMLLATQGTCATPTCRAEHPVAMVIACRCPGRAVVVSYEAGCLILRCPTCSTVGWNVVVRDDTRFAPALNN